MPSLNGEQNFNWTAELQRPVNTVSAPCSPISPIAAVGQFVVTSTGTGTTPITSALKEENLDNESVECWQIRFTKEIYDDYEQYFQRLQNYRRPIWACSITGNKGLTFEQALLSERRAREHSLRLPRVLQRQLLERIQFSTVTRIDALTDQLHAALADRYFCGEELLFNRGEGEQVTAVIVLQEPKEHGEKFYKVRLVEDGKGELSAKKEQLSRQRNVLSKQSIRQYIKDSASKDSHLNSPWIIKPELAEKFQISTAAQPADVLWDEKEKRWRIKRLESDEPSGSAQPPSKKRRKSGAVIIELPKPKYPIEDSELPHYIAQQKPSHRHPEMETSAVPLPSKEFTLSPSAVHLLISVWDFLYVFAKPLELSPFTFDDFEAALRQDEAASSNPIVDQTHWRLLQLASQYTNSLVAKAKPVKTAKTQRRVDSLASSNVTAARYEDELSGSATEDEPSSPMATAAASTAETAAAAAAVTEIDASFPERWWTWRIKKDEWENALCAYLLHLGTVQSVPHLQSIVSKLTGLQAQIDPRDGRADFAYGDRYWNDGESVDFRENYALLNVEEKLECLWLLINESVVPSQRCRKFIEQCSQALAEARKEKRELDVNMRESLEALGVLNKPAAPEKSEQPKDKKSSEPEPAAGDDDDDQEASALIAVDDDDEEDGGGDDDDDSDDDSEAGDGEYGKEIRDIRKKLDQFDEDDTSRQARQEKVRLQQQLRDLENAWRMERVRLAREAAKQKHAESRAKIEEKKRLDADIEKLHKKDIVLDREIRQNLAAVNLKPLGRDRFWNMYFWLDGYGSGMTAVQDCHGNQGNVRNLLPYSSGRLFVLGSGRPAYLGHVSGASARQISGKRKVVDMKALEQQEVDGWIADPFVTLPLGFDGKKPGALLGDNWLAEDEWAYYDSPEQIDELLCWLNPKGVREQHLKGVLTKYYDMITFCLRKRQQDLAVAMQSGEMRSRPSTRHHNTVATEPYLLYQNRWAPSK